MSIKKNVKQILRFVTFNWDGSVVSRDAKFTNFVLNSFQFSNGNFLEENVKQILRSDKFNWDGLVVSRDAKFANFVSNSFPFSIGNFLLIPRRFSRSVLGFISNLNGWIHSRTQKMTVDNQTVSVNWLNRPNV